MSLFGYDHALDLLKARVMLAADGGLETRHEKGLVDTTVILPGASYYVRMVKNDKGERGQLYFPSGRGLHEAVDITDPQSFATLLHGADASIKARRAHYDVPTEMFMVADRMIHLKRQGVPGISALPAGNIERMSRFGQWQPTRDVETMIEKLATHDDPAMNTLTRRLIEVKNGKPSAAFDNDASVIRWLDQTGSWMTEAMGEDPDVFGADGFEWREISNHASMAAASRRVGGVEGFISNSATTMSQEEVTDTLRRLLRGDPKQKDWPEKTFFELVDPNGRSCALGIVDQMQIIIVRTTNPMITTPDEASRWLRTGLAAERQAALRPAV